MKHHSLVKWEKRLDAVLGRLDHYLEDTHGSKYTLHPARASRGATANAKYDGLFNVSAKYTAGYGSVHGAGYVIDVNAVTLATIPEGQLKRIEDDAAAWLRAELPAAFPKRHLSVDRDGTMYKIHGDLSLGDA